MAERVLLPKVVQRPASNDVQVVSDRMAVLLHGEDTQGAFALLHAITNVNEGPPLHVHHREDETFYILKGEYEFALDGKRIRVHPGDVVFGARNVPHTYRNAGAEPAEMLVHVSPAGFEVFFQAVGKATASGGMTPEELTEMAAEYGCDILGPPLGP